MSKSILLVKEFGPFPYGRYPSDGDYNGQAFREKILAPRLREAIDNEEVLLVNLDGYNRYGPSFLDEAFGGLIRESGFTPKEIESHLRYNHTLVKSVEILIKQRIAAAEQAGNQN
ncbi:MAG: DUF4325 domain-containing protein [Rheinheimera sp.]|uniref:STAS-like domain-containing protein n=1 Tax=Arsukibacterium sp. UBA3155 TaxID=1946058 RepID=UPI000C985CDA|nr:STAS-like domain-containing protein [Arsukibacterium sp. UBA3155]MAD75130.1 DUF4325 domain-containing protein [Rheinheimera sp.]|tara:strand:+ start:51683 stop:52027 length:345 start_codon:yes stop_codon:yes gene_type:complete